MIYLIHFQTPFMHCKHYLGYCADDRLEKRIYEHFNAPRVALMQMIKRKGIPWEVARLMEGGRDREAHLKYQIKKIAPYCPICTNRRSRRVNALDIRCFRLNQRVHRWMYKHERIDHKTYLWVSDLSEFQKQYPLNV